MNAKPLIGTTVGSAIAASADPVELVRTHHKYGMSKLNALDACAGFTSRNEVTEAAQDGTRKHDIMERIAQRLINRLKNKKKLSARQELSDLLESGDVFVDDDERTELEFCCDDIDEWLKYKATDLLVEIKVTIRHPDGKELNHGYLDIVLIFDDIAVLIDYKFGWIPVPPAEGNLQGMGYSTALFQEKPALKTIKVVFSQPRLNRRTKCTYKREQLFDMYSRIKGVIAKAEDPNKHLKINPYCDFCELNGKCAAHLRNAQALVVKHDNLPMGDLFTSLEITTPQQALAAYYIADRLEAIFKEAGVRDKVLEFARANGGRLEHEVAPGQHLVVEVKEKKSPRSANSPLLIAETIAEEVGGIEQAQALVLSACDVSVTTLEDNFADLVVEKRKAEAEQMGKEEAKEHRLTKKAAKEMLSDVLSSEGYVSRSDKKVEYLKLRVEKSITPAAQLSPA
jgi:hypothetical protein